MRLESYDLFDTLITRVTCNPRDIFRLLGAAGVVSFRWKIVEVIPFHVWRRRAERLARWLSPREDIRLKDVYRILGLVIMKPAEVMRLEVSLENAAIRPIPGAVSELIEQHSTGSACCIVSDMYLPKSVLRRFVRKHVCDIPLHVSSEVGLTKTKGSLFHHVATMHGVPLSSIHHRGDNPVADHAVPLRLGMQATLIPVHQKHSSVCALDVFKCPREGDSLYEMGFRVAGPTAFAMATCLTEHVKTRPPLNIIFAARDMHLVKYAFHLISTHTPAHYCRISRSAVYRAQWHASADPRRWFEGVATGAAFFARLGLECPADLANLAPLRHSQRFLHALKDAGFSHECELEYHILHNYLEYEGFGDGSLFVDLGWRGSIQDAVNQVLALTNPIEGWYFGTLEQHTHKHGLYFAGSRPYGRFHRVLQAVSFFEFLFTEATPSLARIVKKGDTFDLVPTDDESPEQLASRERIAAGARAFIDMMIPFQQVAHFGPDKLIKALDALYDRYLLAPPAHWVKALDSMTHSGGFGGSGTSPLIGDDTGTPLGFLKAPWKGGYVVKHRNSPWSFVLNAMNRSTTFVAYDVLKREVRRRRMARLHQ